jgi:HD-GYP domain-containing protein (c-di-GMP phosphodiesterase class II)
MEAIPDSPPAAPDPAQKNSLSLTEVQEHSGAYRNYTDLIEMLDLIFGMIARRNPAAPDSADLIESIDVVGAGVLKAVQEERDDILGFILGGEVEGHELAKKSVNSAILAALIAQELKLSRPRVLLIITGALLHDVGMLRLPREILDKQGGLSQEELRQVKAHPVYSYTIISKDLLYPGDAGVIGLQHHERWDGQGYPRRLSGTDIEIGARIISVVDAFEAMVSRKTYRNPLVGYQAMKNLLSDNGRRFDPDVLKAFIQTMGIYPIGSVILLNNGAWARVVEVQKDSPLRPTVRVLVAESGMVYQQGDGALINLLSEKKLFIVRAIEPEELAQKNA